MFTGLVEAVGDVKAVRSTKVGRRLLVELGRLVDDAKLGDSICVNGACLTINELSGDVASFDVISETLRATTLGRLKAGGRVNLERALRAGDRFGGHIVQGHVDGVGTVDEVDSSGGEHVLWVAAEPGLMGLMIVRGSAAINGVSLTIAGVEKKRFGVALIPTTLAETTMGEIRAGDEVNIEADLIGKWINKRLDEIVGSGGGDGDGQARLTLEKLRQQGFA